jgi:hypothetical protein
MLLLLLLLLQHSCPHTHRCLVLHVQLVGAGQTTRLTPPYRCTLA